MGEVDYTGPEKIACSIRTERMKENTPDKCNHQSMYYVEGDFLSHMVEIQIQNGQKNTA